MTLRKKVIFLINTVTPYQIDFFEKLSNYVDLSVIFYSKNYQNYNFNFKKKKNHFFLSYKKKPVEFFYKFIQKVNPDLVIFGGYRLKYNSRFISHIKKKKIKFFYWLEKLNERNYLKYKFTKYLISKKINKADGVLAVGSNAKKMYSRYNKNTFNFPYSIKTQKQNKKNYFNNKKINFLFVGQLIKRKGLDEIIKMIDLLSEKDKEKISIHIVGDGKMKNTLKKLSNKNYFNYYGFIFGKKLIKIYNRSDVLLFPSKFDGWGVVAMEAMSNSLSVVASKNTGVSEFLKNKKSGFVIEPNATNLYKVVKKYIKNKKQIIKQGKYNRNLILKSKCNRDNLSNFFFKNVLNSL